MQEPRDDSHAALTPEEQDVVVRVAGEIVGDTDSMSEGVLEGNPSADGTCAPEHNFGSAPEKTVHFANSPQTVPDTALCDEWDHVYPDASPQEPQPQTDPAYATPPSYVPPPLPATSSSPPPHSPPSSPPPLRLSSSPPPRYALSPPPLTVTTTTTTAPPAAPAAPATPSPPPLISLTAMPATPTPAPTAAAAPAPASFVSLIDTSNPALPPPSHGEGEAEWACGSDDEGVPWDTSVQTEDTPLSYSLHHSRIREQRRGVDTPMSLTTVRKGDGRWVDDDHSVQCQREGCTNQFSVTMRKHHCRRCGRLFCSECITFTDKLAASEAVAQPIVARMMRGVRNIVRAVVEGTGALTKEVVCSPCGEELELISDLDHQVWLQIGRNVPIPDMYSMLFVNRRMFQVASHWRDIVRGIQYRLPTHTYSADERFLLWSNRAVFVGHSVYLKHLLRIADLTDTRVVRDLVSLLQTRTRAHACARLMCSRTCKPSIGVLDAVEMLDGWCVAPEIRAIAVDVLRQSVASERPRAVAMVDALIPVLVQMIRHERIADGPLASFLIDYASRAQASGSVTHTMFWGLRVHIDTETENALRGLYRGVMDRFRIALTLSQGAAACLALTRSSEFVDVLRGTQHVRGHDLLMQFYDHVQPFIEDAMETHVMRPADEAGIVVPVFADYPPISAVDYRGIRPMTSNMAPLRVPCVLSDPHEVIVEPSSNTSATRQRCAFLYKRGDDLRQDQVAIAIVRVMDEILRAAGLNLDLLTYNVVPTGALEGLVEWVEDASTIDDIAKSTSINNYILNNNHNHTVSHVRDVYCKSLAAYSVVTFLLGVGDRHEGNIMLTKSGRLFHIDFGYILGNDPKPLIANTMNFKVTGSMVEALGGEVNNHSYQVFHETCHDAYHILRKHAPLFMTMLSTVPGINIAAFHNQFLKRFAPSRLDSDCDATLNEHIRNDRSSWGTTFYGFLHRTSMLVATSGDAAAKSKYAARASPAPRSDTRSTAGATARVTAGAGTGPTGADQGDAGDAADGAGVGSAIYSTVSGVWTAATSLLP